MVKVFIVEDDDVIAKMIEKHLSSWQMEAKIVEDFHNVTEEALNYGPDIILMDLKLPVCNGFFWCSEIRKTSNVPIVFLSSADDNMNIVMAMNMGADDFISKPFDLQVLTAKIQAILRRSSAHPETAHFLSCGGVKLNLDDTTAMVGDEKLELTKNEFLILKTLMESPGKVISRETIMERLWGDEEFVDDNTLTVNVTRIRKKIENAGLNNYIVTKRGMGYIVGEEGISE
ncbi:response regulator transcription factor [Butyrivibrio sp. INlla21]|uniref:response regulator transcription factor n=1 Tax=Butyrivibrio sp. INlla21 TaxID=1520811 RepID=UPI000B85AAAA